jgi:hypothetical protein
MDTEQEQPKRRGAQDDAGGDWSGGPGDGSDSGEGCFGCLMWPLRAGWCVIKGVVGLIVKIGDTFAGGDGD